MDPIMKLDKLKLILGHHDDTHHAADNLLGVILDLEREAVQNPIITGTLKRVHNQLKQVHDLLATDHTQPEAFPHVIHHEEPQLEE